MPQGAYGMRDMHTTEPEFAAFHEAVNIEPESNADHQFTPSGFFFDLLNLKPSVKRRVFASGLRWVLAMR